MKFFVDIYYQIRFLIYSLIELYCHRLQFFRIIIKLIICINVYVFHVYYLYYIITYVIFVHDVLSIYLLNLFIFQTITIILVHAYLLVTYDRYCLKVFIN